MTDEARPAATIHPAKLAPLPADRLRVEPADDGTVATDPARSGWRYLSFRTVHLGAGQALELHERERETAIVTISGGGVEIAVASGPDLRLVGRPSVFEGMPWSAYLPAGCDARITGRPLPGREAVVAIATAPLSGRAGTHFIPVRDYRLFVRGVDRMGPETP